MSADKGKQGSEGDGVFEDVCLRELADSLRGYMEHSFADSETPDELGPEVRANLAFEGIVRLLSEEICGRPEGSITDLFPVRPEVVEGSSVDPEASMESEESAVLNRFGLALSNLTKGVSNEETSDIRGRIGLILREVVSK